jgi:hypothetical protein
LKKSSVWTQKLEKNSTPAVWKEGRPFWKCAFFVGHDFSYKSDNKPQLKFHLKNDPLPIHWMIPRMPSPVDKWPTLGPLESGAAN